MHGNWFIVTTPSTAVVCLFGAYDKGNEVTMKVDYVRYYQWELNKGNELLNSEFECREMTLSEEYQKYELPFSTNPEYKDHLRTVKISFTNGDASPVSLDDIEIIKI